MIDVALRFLVQGLNAYLASRVGPGFGEVVLSPIAGEKGAWSLGENQVGASLISFEEERVHCSQLPETRSVEGRDILHAPPLKLNLHVLFAARFAVYEQGLRHLSLLLTYFQAHSTFTPETNPGLDPRIEHLGVELQSLSFEQLNQIWAFVGSRLLPSAVYRVRLISLQDEEPLAVAVPIQRVAIEAHQ